MEESQEGAERERVCVERETSGTEGTAEGKVSAHTRHTHTHSLTHTHMHSWLFPVRCIKVSTSQDGD